MFWFCEDERIFIGGYNALKFSTIRLLTAEKGWVNYKYYIKALTKYHQLIKGEDVGSFTQKDVLIISGLNDDLCGIEKNKFPIYINKIFAQFANNIKKININIYENKDVFNDLYFSSFFLCPATYNNLSPNINTIYKLNLKIFA